jgi:peptidoglycan/xylan/chitin deacetylase (PgdA/CDA1 family)
LAAGLALVMAGAYLIHLSGTAGHPVTEPTRSAAALAPVASYQADTGGREYFISHQVVVPVGASTIEMPILMYHYVRTPPSPLFDPLGYRLSVSPEVFQAQMTWLDTNGFHPVTFDDVRAYFAGLQPLPPKPVVITLDDGYRDLYTTAYPVLAGHNFKAVAYIVTGFVGWPEYVTRDQILEMDHHGIEIASHTVDHPNLARSSVGSVTFEVVTSKNWLESLLGHPVLDFAYPSGKYSAQVVDVLKAAGYDTAVTEDFSTVHTQQDRYTWTRVRVGGGESLMDFAAALGPTMDTVTLTQIEIEIDSPVVNVPSRLRPGY